jgi:hypothetical protein
MLTERREMARKFEQFFDQLLARFEGLPDGCSLSVDDNGYYANKATTSYPEIRYSMNFWCRGTSAPTRTAPSQELQAEVEDLGLGIMKVLGENWACSFEMRKEGGQVEVHFTLPVLGPTEVRSDPLPPSKAKQFLRLDILYGDISQFGVDLEFGTVRYAELRRGTDAVSSQVE